MEGYTLLRVSGANHNLDYLWLSYEIPSLYGGMTRKILGIDTDKCFTQDGRNAGSVKQEIYKSYCINLWVPVDKCSKDLQDYIKYGDTVINRQGAIKIMEKYGYCDKLAQKVYSYLSQYDRYRVYRRQLEDYIK